MSTGEDHSRVTSFAPQFLVDDLKRSMSFYETLGFTFGDPWGGFYAIGFLDGLELHLKEAPKNPAERKFRREQEHLDAAAGVDGIDAFYDKCVANGVQILRPLSPTEWGTKDFYIEDPDGYVISFGGGPSPVATESAAAQNRLELVRPSDEHLAGYVEALTRGWSSEPRRPEAAREELARITADSKTFLEQQFDPEGRAPPITLPDGSRVPRLPSYRLWMWDGSFCGSISLRWERGTTALPPHCLGHIGYGVVPWKRRRGYATRALGLILPLAKAQGLPFVEITTDVSNFPSQRVILSNGGEFFERFTKPASHGGGEGLRFRIWLSA